MASIDSWINDNLHKVLGISDKTLVQFIKSSGNKNFFFLFKKKIKFYYQKKKKLKNVKLNNN